MNKGAPESGKGSIPVPVHTLREVVGAIDEALGVLDVRQGGGVEDAINRLSLSRALLRSIYVSETGTSLSEER